MMKNNWGGRLWVQIPVPAKFFTSKISVRYIYLLVLIALHEINACERWIFHCFPHGPWCHSTKSMKLKPAGTNGRLDN